MKVSFIAENGDQGILDIYQQDEFFGESAFVNLTHRGDQATAMESTKLMTWTIDVIEDVIMRRPRLAAACGKRPTAAATCTTWTVVTDDPLISTTSIDTLAIDPSNHNTIYAGTGDLNFGSFSMGSQGILKSTDAGATWTVLGENVFGMIYNEPPGQYPQYNAVGKVRVDPNNSNKVVAGTKQGLYFSYDGGANWTGPCFTNNFSTQRQDVTGLGAKQHGWRDYSDHCRDRHPRVPNDCAV